MNRPARPILSIAAVVVAATPALADNIVRLPETVIVTGSKITEATSTATGLDLTAMETPQTLVTVGQQQIRDFGLTTANSLLDQVAGVNVERVETDRTYYNARGFDITNFQFDGIGLPMVQGLTVDDLDTVIFDQVQVAMGADGLTTGTGNPSATVNFVRKRPLQDFAANLSASIGSWDARRFEVDVSSPLNDSGTLRARGVYANEDDGSYLDHYHRNRNVAYGVVEWDVTPDLTVTAGYSWQDDRPRGVLWGGLPFEYSDGTLIQYPVSASTAADWTYWHVREQYAFGEVAYRLSDWTLKASGTYHQHDEGARLLYANGYPDPGTGANLVALSGLYPSTNKQFFYDFTASGPFSLFGREHQLVFGVDTAQSYEIDFEATQQDSLIYPPVSTWGTEQIPLPTYNPVAQTGDFWTRQYRAYAAAHLTLLDDLKAVVGADYVAVKTKGIDYGADQTNRGYHLSPYAGLIWSATPNVNAYFAYTSIFNPQFSQDVNHHLLPAAEGNSYEGGVKSQWFDNHVLATFAIFKSEQLNLATAAGTFPDGKNYYTGVDTSVFGYEARLTGALTDQWSINAGWAELHVKDPLDINTSTYIPRETFKLSTTYLVPSLNDLRLGAALRWKSETSIMDLVEVSQGAYAVIDLMAGVRVFDNLQATLNVDNVTDEKYWTSMQWNQSFYGEPRSVTFRLSYAY